MRVVQFDPPVSPGPGLRGPVERYKPHRNERPALGGRHGRIGDQHRRQRALAAASLQWVLARGGLLDGGSIGRLAGGTIFLGAGLYQFSALKQACLTLCQRPFPFFFSNWTTERGGVLRLGLRQGMLCLGCCWAMMVLMFALGAMNVMWMAALGVLMTIEKLSTTARFSEAVGFGFVAVGFGMIVWSVV